MGRRSRQRASTSDSGDALGPARKTIAAYIVAAGIIGVLTLVGIGTIGGVFGPILVFLAVVTLAFSLQRNVAGRLEGLELSEEDRLMRLLATGVLATAALLAFVSAIVSLIAG